MLTLDDALLASFSKEKYRILSVDSFLARNSSSGKNSVAYAIIPIVIRGTFEGFLC